MTIAQIKSFLSDGAVSVGLLFVSLTEIDLWIRISSGVIGASVGIVTLLSIIQRMQINAIDRKIKKLDMKMREEKTRRYFESKYSDK